MVERVRDRDGRQLYHREVPLVKCGAGCGQALRCGESDIMARDTLGHGGPICPCCKTCFALEHFATELLGAHKPTNQWGYE